jgi:alkylation response protein AidB-like acyl-CoA dehydrogenase
MMDIPAPFRLPEVTVSPEWTDYNHHLTESAYLLIMGESSDAFFRFFGVDDAYRAAGHSLYTVETHLRNLREAYEGERLSLTIQVLGTDAKRLHILHEMYRATGGLIATAEQMLLQPSNILLGCNSGQRERYLLPAIRGERHDCVAMTEPGSGSDIRSMSTTARRDGDDYVINGTKHFISHADVADFVILFAATGDFSSPKKRISVFLVDKDSPGLTVTRGSECVSNRGYHQCELSFADCRVPAANLLGEEGRGFDLMGQWLGATRLTVAATSVGRARRVLEAVTEWAATRRQFGQPVGRFQGVGFQLADCAASRTTRSPRAAAAAGG